MSNRVLTRKNVKGMIFSCPKHAYRTVEAWLHAKAPSDSVIYDTPTQLLAHGIPISDGHKVDGVYYRRQRQVPEVVKVVLPATSSMAKILDLNSIKPEEFPSLVYFDKSKNVRSTTFGTASPSKISKGSA